MKKRQEEPAAPLTIERKTIVRLTHELVEKILRGVLKVPVGAIFIGDDYGRSIECAFEWHETEPLADLTQLDAIKGNPISPERKPVDYRLTDADRVVAQAHCPHAVNVTMQVENEHTLNPLVGLGAVFENGAKHAITMHVAELFTGEYRANFITSAASALDSWYRTESKGKTDAR